MNADYCSSCKKHVEPVKRDFGIGAFEYWGSREVHVDMRIVCPYCETETTEEPCIQDEECDE